MYCVIYYNFQQTFVPYELRLLLGSVACTDTDYCYLAVVTQLAPSALAPASV